MSIRALSSLFLSLCLFPACQLERHSQGKNLYTHYCASCHMDDGTGLEAIYPPLSNADYYRDNQAKIACIIRYGLDGEILVNNTSYATKMEAIPSLNEVEIHNLINYINSAWDNEVEMVTIKEVKTQLDLCDAKPN